MNEEICCVKCGEYANVELGNRKLCFNCEKERALRTHYVKKGDVIRSMKQSPIWIDKGEVFTVEGIVTSQYDDFQGVSFIDRTGSKRVFWFTSEYEVVSSEQSRIGYN